MSVRQAATVIAAALVMAAPGVASAVLPAASTAPRTTATAAIASTVPAAPAVGAARTRVVVPYVRDGWPNPLPAYGPDLVAHDPSMVQGADSRWYVFSTHDGVQVRVSGDRQHWTRLGAAFPHGVALAKQYNGNPMEIWAPDVSRHHGTYFMYYAVSSFGSNNSAIGLATSATAATGSWTDQGLVFATKTGDTINAIDPNLAVDSAGRWWLTFGSFWSGIAQIRLDPATGHRLAGDTAAPKLLASRPDLPSHAVEAPFLVQRGRWYYLFMSFDLCCQGEASSYREMVGRSLSPRGPFYDATGRALLDGGGTQIVGTHDTYIGTGGGSVVRDRHGYELVYHYYDGLAAGLPHLALNRLEFDNDGWPHLA